MMIGSKWMTRGSGALLATSLVWTGCSSSKDNTQEAPQPIAQTPTTTPEPVAAEPIPSAAPLRAAIDAPTRAKARPRHALREVSPDTAFTLDGKLDEPIWQALEPLVLQPMSAAPARESWVKMMRRGDALIVGAWMQDEHVWGTLAKRDSNTWTQEVLELFIDTNADERDYLELQITPQNTIFDANFKARLGRGEGSREAQIDRARAWNMAGLESAVWVDGTLNDEAQADRGWSVELRLPLASIPGVTAIPRAGETWAMNLYRFDRPKPDQPRAYAWSTAASRDFHEIGGYGQLIFAAPPAPDAPATPDAPAAPAAPDASAPPTIAPPATPDAPSGAKAAPPDAAKKAAAP